jgi:serine/threonine protein kinase
VVEPPSQLQAALADRYTIESELGRGGMGIVYRAWDLKHARPVALKVVRPEFGSVLAAERFLREIQLAAKLQHPHIVPLYDSGDAGGALFYVMPLVEGESLRARLVRERQLPLDEALQITREVADALSYAHSHDVVHRDIKPENILFAGGHAVVVDFGIGRAITAAGGDRLTESGISVGTPAYMSPEQATADTQVDGRSDVYSLACVLYEMLAGHPPFLGATAREVLARHTLDPVPSLRTARSTVPVALERAISRGLAKVPADRFATAIQFVSALEQASTAPPETAAAPLVPQPPQRTRALIGLGVLVAALGVTAALRLRRPAGYTPGRVVVAPLENQTRDPSLNGFLQQLATTLSDAIAREGVGEPVPPATVRDLLSRATGSPGQVAEWLAHETGAGLELRGACSRAAAGTTCQLDVLRMPAKVLRMSVSMTGDPAQPTFGAELTERVLAALLLQRAFGDRARWLGEYVPRSLAAARAFEEAWASDDWKYLSEAARLDTGWVDAAVIATEDSSDAAADATLARLAHRSRLLEGERENIALHQASLHGDPELAFDLARRRFAVNPEMWVNPVTVYAVVTSRATTALAVSSYADSTLHPGAATLAYGFRARALHQVRRYEDELRLAQDLEQRFPTVVWYRGFEAEALAALGMVDSLRRRLAEWEATPEPSPRGPSAGTRSFGAALELMAHGHEREGRDVLGKTLRLYRQLRHAEGYNPNEVLVLMWTDQLEEARRGAEAALPMMKSLNDSLNYLGPLGSIAARQGKRADAARYERLLTSASRRPAFRSEAAFQQATIVSWLGDREGAVRLLEDARAHARHGGSSGTPWNVHRWPDFAGLRGYPPYERFLRPRE